MNSRRHRARGMSTLKTILLIPAALIAILVLTFGFYEARKAYWDYQVDKLCAQDGGVKINEVMYVDAQQYEKLKNKFGQLAPPFKNELERAGTVAFLADSTIYIRRNDPTVAKHVLSIIRSTDGVALATRTSYGRSDGDLISLHPSSYICQPGQANYFQSVLKLQGKNK
ncbi:MAG: hypothetical protein ACYCZ6_02330 [Polaromonas sp.]